MVAVRAGPARPWAVTRGTNGFQVFEALLDVRIGKRFSPTFLIDLGRFKADFSRDWILAISDADFAARSAVALALSPARQMGVQARKTLADGRVELAVRAFNGNALASGNDDNDLMWTGRVGTWVVLSIQLVL